MLEKWAITALIGVALFATGFFGGCSHGRKTEAANWIAESAASNERFREKEKAWQEEKESITDEAQSKIKKLENDVAASRAAAIGVRNQLACARDPACNPAAGTGSQAAIALADVFGACDAEYREMGKDAQRSRIAGETCENNTTHSATVTK